MDGGETANLLNRDEIARALKVSAVTISAWMAPDEFEGGLPCEQRGGNGRPYQFNLEKCLSWRTRRREHEERLEQDRERAINESHKQLDLIGGEGTDALAGLSSRARSEYYQAELQRMKAEAERGRLVDAAEVAREFEAVFQRLARFLQTLPDAVEREIGLDPGAVEALREMLDAEQSALARDLMTQGRLQHDDD